MSLCLNDSLDLIVANITQIPSSWSEGGASPNSENYFLWNLTSLSEYSSLFILKKKGPLCFLSATPSRSAHTRTLSYELLLYLKSPFPINLMLNGFFYPFLLSCNETKDLSPVIPVYLSKLTSYHLPTCSLHSGCTVSFQDYKYAKLFPTSGSLH